VIAPYPIAEPVAQIAQQALSTAGIENMQKQVLAIDNQRLTLKHFLQSLDAVQLVGDDKANFILFRTADKSALMDFLVKNQILIRDQSKQLNLQNCLRITVGNELQNQTLMNLISVFYSTQETLT